MEIEFEDSSNSNEEIYDSEENEEFYEEIVKNEENEKEEKKEEDEVIKKFDVYLTHDLSKNLFLFQYPLRPISRPYDFNTIKKCLYKKNHQKFWINFERNTQNEHFDSEHYQTDDPNNSLFNITSTKVPMRAAYAIGVLRSNEFHLTPLENILQFRPDTSYLDSDEFWFEKGAEKVKKKKATKKKPDIFSKKQKDEAKEDDNVKEEKETKRGRKKKVENQDEEDEEEEEEKEDKEKNMVFSSATPIINKKELEQMKNTYYYYKHQESLEKPTEIQLVLKNDDLQDMASTKVFDRLFYQQYNSVTNHLSKKNFLNQWLKIEKDSLNLGKKQKLVSLEFIQNLANGDLQISVAFQVANVLNYVRISSMCTKIKNHHDRLRILENATWHLGDGIFIIKSDFLGNLDTKEKAVRDIAIQLLFEKIIEFEEGNYPENYKKIKESNIKRTTKLAFFNYFKKYNSNFSINKVFPLKKEIEIDQFIHNEIFSKLGDFNKKTKTWDLKSKPLKFFNSKFKDFSEKMGKNWNNLIQMNENTLKSEFQHLNYISSVTSSSSSDTFTPSVSQVKPTQEKLQTAQQLEKKKMMDILKVYLLSMFKKYGVCSYSLLWNYFLQYQQKKDQTTKNIKEPFFKYLLNFFAQPFTGPDIYVLKFRKKDEEEFRKPIIDLFSRNPEKEFSREEMFDEVKKFTNKEFPRSIYLKILSEIAVESQNVSGNWIAKKGTTTGR